MLGPQQRPPHLTLRRPVALLLVAPCQRRTGIARRPATRPHTAQCCVRTWGGGRAAPLLHLYLLAVMRELRCRRLSTRRPCPSRRQSRRCRATQ